MVLGVASFCTSLDPPQKRKCIAQKEAYAVFLTTLPKFEGDQAPVVFLQALEKHFNEHEVPVRKWLGALEGCLTGKALNTYWNLIGPRRQFLIAWVWPRPLILIKLQCVVGLRTRT